MPLSLIIGPMFSGKTSLLVGKALSFIPMGGKVVLVCHSTDTRADTNLSSHNVSIDLKKLEKECDVITGTSLRDVFDKNKELIESADAICVDEIQFFTDVEIIDDLANTKFCYASGLSGTFNRTQIGELHKLIPYADDIQHVKSVCTECWHERKEMIEAPFTFIDPSHRNDDNLVGGADKYMPLCRNCWNSKK
jgi:thymidine kinase